LHVDQQPPRSRKERQTCCPLSRVGGGSFPIKSRSRTPWGTNWTNDVSVVTLEKCEPLVRVFVLVPEPTVVGMVMPDMTKVLDPGVNDEPSDKVKAVVTEPVVAVSMEIVVGPLGYANLYSDGGK